MDWLKLLLDSNIVFALIPLGGISLGALGVWVRHQERLAKIQAGLDPDAGTLARD